MHHRCSQPQGMSRVLPPHSQCGEAWIQPCNLRTVQFWVSSTSPGWLPTKRWQKSLLAGLRGFRATKANWQAAGYQVA